MTYVGSSRYMDLVKKFKQYINVTETLFFLKTTIIYINSSLFTEYNQQYL